MCRTGGVFEGRAGIGGGPFGSESFDEPSPEPLILDRFSLGKLVAKRGVKYRVS